MAGNSDSSQTLRMAVCLGGTSIDAAALDYQGAIVEKNSFSTSAGGALMDACKLAEDRIAFTLEHWDEFVILRKALLDDLGQAITSLAESVCARGYTLSGVGISAPGPVHPLTGDILGRTGALNLPAWGEFNLNQEIQERTGPAVRSINDAKAMALGALARISTDVMTLSLGEDGLSVGEKILGNEGLSIADFIEIDPGTGLGGGYIVDRKVWFGPDPENPDPDVGEIWKLPADPDQPDINFEELTAGRATLRRVEESLRSKGSEEVEALIESSKGRLKTMLRTAIEPLQRIIDGELTRTGRYLGLGIRYIMNAERKRLKAPDIRTFMIGGGLVSGTTPEAGRIRALLFTAMRQELQKSAPDTRILFTVLGGDAGIYGSACIAP